MDSGGQALNYFESITTVIVLSMYTVQYIVRYDSNQFAPKIFHINKQLPGITHIGGNIYVN